MSNDGLFALMSGTNRQTYLLDVFDLFLPLGGRAGRQRRLS
jgi:hypothetical protein